MTNAIVFSYVGNFILANYCDLPHVDNVLIRANYLSIFPDDSMAGFLPPKNQ